MAASGAQAREAAARMVNFSNVCGDANTIRKLTYEDSVNVTAMKDAVVAGAGPAPLVTSLTLAADRLSKVEKCCGNIQTHPLLAASAVDVAAGADWLTDVDAQAWATAAGTVSRMRLDLVSDFLRAEKAAGVYQRTDDYWLLAGENNAQCLTSLKQKRLCVAVGTPVFVVDRHVLNDGVASYLNTGFIPATHAVLGTVDDRRIDAYERTTVITNTESIGSTSSGTATDRLEVLRNNNGILGMLGHNTTGATLTPVAEQDGRGLTSYQRTPGGVYEFAKNGVAIGTNTVTPTATRSAQPLYIGALNNSGTAQAFRPATTAFAAYGMSLSSPQRLAAYTNLQTLLAAIGAAV